MSDRLFVATRKGLFTLERRARWTITGAHFLGDNASMVLPDGRAGRRDVYVALGHGHFGGFGVAVHPADADTAWFVPGESDEHRIPVAGRVVVPRTRDGGRSFDVLTNGLPRSTRTISPIGTRSTSTRRATGSPSARPPDRCGCRRIRATVGRRCPSICRRCTARGSARR